MAAIGVPVGSIEGRGDGVCGEAVAACDPDGEGVVKGVGLVADAHPASRSPIRIAVEYGNDEERN